MGSSSRATRGTKAVATAGLILGKFLPPHAGHLHLIDVARAQVDTLTVVVGSLAREPIPGALRVRWLRELRPGVEFLPLAEELPQYPEEHPQFWEMWTAALRRVIPRPPDLVFSSEAYGDELARRLGAKHVLVDRDRSQVPISATAIRNDPLTNWEFIPKPARPWFVKRVLITGAESTGKTTLARELAERFGTAWVPEYAREHLDAKPVAFSGPAGVVTLEDLETIARRQGEREDLDAREANRVLFCDTDASVTAIYADRYCGKIPPSITAEVARRRYDLALVTGLDVPFEADRQRDSAHLREDLHRRFRQTILDRQIPLVDLRGDPAAVLSSAESAVRAAFGL